MSTFFSTKIHCNIPSKKCMRTPARDLLEDADQPERIYIEPITKLGRTKELDGGRNRSRRTGPLS